MTKPELLKIMAYVYAEHEIALSEDRIAVWWDQFKHVDYPSAQRAARMLTARKSFGAPKAQDFSAALAEVEEISGGQETWGEAWDKFSRIALRYGIYQVEKILPAVEAVSPLAAAAMKTGVREFLTSDESDLPTIRAQFRQRYEALQARERQTRRMPLDMRPSLPGQANAGDLVSNIVKQLTGEKQNA